MLTKEIRQAIREEADYTKNHSPKSQQILQLLNDLDDQDAEIERLRKESENILQLIANNTVNVLTLKEQNEHYRKALEEVKFHNSDTVTNDRRIRHIIGQIVDKILKGESE